MTSYLKKAHLMVFAIIMVGFLTWPMAVRANSTSTTLYGGFAPVAQDQAATPQAPPQQSGVDLNDLQTGAMRFEANKVYTGERISLDFQNADLHNIIRIIGEVSGKNIVVSDAVSGKVTLKLKDVPWDQALDIVLSSRNLGVEESGNVLTVYDLPTLHSIRAGRAELEARRLEAAAQAPLVKKVFTPKYAPISTVSSELDKIKSTRGKIVAIGNDIYVEDDPGSIATMSQIFMRVDRVAKQILIEARIIEATATFVNSLGINWSAEYNGSGVQKNPNNLNPDDASGSIDISNAGARLGFGFLNKAGTLLLNANIQARETASEARTISAPRIMAANDQKVSIKQGQQIPYKSGSSANTAANVQFKDVVMELEVTPHIEENGQIVTLDIKLTNDTIDSSAGASEEPAINTREAETKLMVKDGETVVIGGILVDSQTDSTDRVPGVHRIPILGWLFQSRGITNSKSEMLIFITANIIPINI